MKINSVPPLKHKYLQMTASIAKTPDKLYFMETLPAERRINVAIVGSRKPTGCVEEVTHQLAFELARRGVVIVSEH